MNKVLILSYYFPPAGGSAVQRGLKFVKYLPQFGWQPVVVTARSKDNVLSDRSLMEEIPEDIQIIRTPAPDLYSWYTRIFGKKHGDADLSALAPDKGTSTGWVGRLALWIRSALFIPDARIGWLPFALIKAIRVIRNEKIGIVFATSPPFTTALVGALLSAITKVPWISDYRDPWTQAYFYFPRKGLSRQWEEFLERSCLRNARRVVSINRRILDGLKDKYGYWPGEKEIVLSNGFDPEDFKDLKPVTQQFFTVTYTGTQNGRMHAGVFLEAAKQLAKEHADFRKEFRINFIGRMGSDVLEILNQAGLSSNLQVMGHLPHRECLRYTLGADLLLLLIPESSGSDVIMTGKLFEYLRSGTPILCLSDHGEAAEIIQEAKAGFTVGGDHPEEIGKILWKCYLNWKKGKNLLPGYSSKGDIEKYNRVEITRQLSGVLKETIMSFIFVMGLIPAFGWDR